MTKVISQMKTPITNKMKMPSLKKTLKQTLKQTLKKTLKKKSGRKVLKGESNYHGEY